MSSFLDQFQSKAGQDEGKEETTNTSSKKIENLLEDPVSLPDRTSFLGEKTEKDPTFKKKQKQRRIFFTVTGSVLITIVGIFWYQVQYVEMPDFSGKSYSDVKIWAVRNKMSVKETTKFSLTHEANTVMKQPISQHKKVKKGSQLRFVVSKGANLETKLVLPDFQKLSAEAAEKWLKKNKVSKLQLVKEYSETAPANQFLRLEMKGEATQENYRRKDNGILYYSKGKETYQKNITVPDFSGKMKSDVEQWAKTNDVEIIYEEESSRSSETGKVLSQSLPPKTKVAKKEQIHVKISLGKGILVPNFSEFTPETAAAFPELKVVVKQQFHESVLYGQMLSQSVAAGTELTERDNQSVTVVYSEGRPYLKDYTGEVEGNLQKLFYEDYQSKGGNIRYTIRYVPSTEKKGTVVSMGQFNTYVPLNYTVQINVSSG